MDNELLEKAALEAVRTAAERLKVDPLRFARFLRDGRIAVILNALSQQEALAAERARVTSLTQAYVEFLEEEMRLCREQIEAMGGAKPRD